MSAHRFEEGLGPDHVGAEEESRVERGPAVVGLRREVHHDIDPLLMQGRHHGVEVGDVGMDEVDRTLKLGQVGAVPGVGEGVVDDHVITRVLVDPVVDEVRPDEPRPSGDKEPHRGVVSQFDLLRP